MSGSGTPNTALHRAGPARSNRVFNPRAAGPAGEGGVQRLGAGRRRGRCFVPPQTEPRAADSSAPRLLGTALGGRIMLRDLPLAFLVATAVHAAPAPKTAD